MPDDTLPQGVSELDFTKAQVVQLNDAVNFLQLIAGELAAQRNQAQSEVAQLRAQLKLQKGAANASA